MSPKDSFLESFEIVSAEELNVREEPSSKARLIGKLYKFECVEVIEKVKYWTKVRYTNKEKKVSIEGWVYTRYIKVFDENTSKFIEDN